MEMGGIEKATSFLRAAGSKKPDLATTHVDPDRFGERNPLAADDAAGLIELREGHRVKFGKI